MENHSPKMRGQAPKGSAAVLVVLAASIFLAAGCASFATVRSAEVQPGPSLALQGSATTRPGDVAGWFWTLDCEQACNDQVVGGDLGLTYGWRHDGGVGSVALRAGTSGVYPYVDGYVQLASGRRPFGIGVRAGLPVTSWREHQLYGRYDIPLSEDARLLLNPAVLLHEGNSPNGENPGSFLGFVQGVGVRFEGEYVSWTPAVALVAGRARRRSYGEPLGPAWSVFGTASLGVSLHRRRSPDR